MRKILTVVFAMLLLIASVSAATFSVTHSGDNVVQVGGEAEFTLKVTNDDFKTKSLQLFPEPFASLPSSYINSFSIEPKMFDINSGETKEVSVKLKMKDTILPQENYATYVDVKDTVSGEKVKHNLVMRVIPPDEVVSVSTSVPATVAPGSQFTVTVDFKNNMNVQLSNVEVYVGSDVFEERKTMILFPLQKRTETFTVKIPDMAKPQDYDFSVRVYQDGVLNGLFSKKFTISQNSDVKQEISVEKGFLSETITVTKTNFGNFVASEYYDYPASSLMRMFLSSSVEPAVDSSGLHWVFDIKPGEKEVIKVKKSYVSLLVIALVVVLFLGISYYLLTRGMIVRKRIFKLKAGKDSAHLTVMIHIKNRTRGPVKDVTVFEILPKMFQPSTHFSTLKPSEQSGGKGEKLTWKIHELSKGEERIISYHMESKISVIGSLSLPVCMVRYTKSNGKTMSVRSNPVRVALGAQQKQ